MAIPNQVFSFDLGNRKVDLSDALSYRIAQSSDFIKLFPVATGGDVATSTEHKWLEGVLSPKTKAFSAYAYDADTSKATFTVTDSSGWEEGDLFHILGDSAVLKVSAKTATTIVPTLVAANGSSLALATYTAANGGTLVFDSRPIPEGSTAGEKIYQESSVESNHTQIFRTEIEFTNTATAVGQYGNENSEAVQLGYATDAIIQRMNAALLFGVKVARTSSNPGSMGGLYYFGTQTGGLSITKSNAALTMNTINNACQKVSDAGGTPNTILCGSGQAQVISTFMQSQVYVENSANTVGRYITNFITSAGGNKLQVYIERSLPDTDVWVIDSSGFKLVPLGNRTLASEPTTAPGKDGVSARVLGEYTAQFKNAKQNLCRISGLKASATVLV